MITINLRPGVRRQVQSGPAFGGMAQRFKDLGAAVREPWRAVAIGAWVLVIGFLGFTWVSTGSKLGTLEPKLEETRAESKRYETFMREKRRAERGRDSVLAQIGTISAVDQERYVWPHILDEVAGAMPDFTWLREITFVAAGGDNGPGGQVNLQIRGLTSDLQNYTAFLRRLEASPWLTNVLAIDAKTAIDRNRALTDFTVQATFSRADSSRIRTVPILESVVR